MSAPDDDAPAGTAAPTIAQVVEAADHLWPFALQAGWDASGLAVGRPEARVHRILLAVDPVAGTVAEAQERGADLLLTHHPLLLRGITSVAADSAKGALVHELIEHGIGLLCCHTNADSALRGVSEVLIAACGVSESAPLEPASSDPRLGIGRVGALPQAVSLRRLAERVAAAVPPTAQGLRVAGDPDRPVRRVAVCGGAGDSLFDAVRAARADVYLTADLRHHPASEARELALLQGGGPALIDLSHAASEWLWAPVGAADLQAELSRRGLKAEVLVSERRTDPWDLHLPSPHPDPQDRWTPSAPPLLDPTSRT